MKLKGITLLPCLNIYSLASENMDTRIPMEAHVKKSILVRTVETRDGEVSQGLTPCVSGVVVVWCASWFVPPGGSRACDITVAELLVFYIYI